MSEQQPPHTEQVPHDPAVPDVESSAVSASTGEPRPSRRSTWLAMGAVAIALAIFWLAPGSTPGPEEAPGVDADAAHPGEPEDAAVQGKMARLDFTLQDMNGVDVTLSAFKGKVILVNFWATWCGPCKAEIPDLVQLQTQYKDDLVVLGVSIDDPVEKLRPYAAEYKMNYPVLVGNGREDFQDAYGPLYGIPVSVIVDREGRIAKKHSGIATREQFEREIKALL